MLTPKTTDSAEELENTIVDMQAAGATALSLVESSSGDDREVKRWPVGPTFRPSTIARQIQARVEKETIYGRQYVVLAWKGETLMDRVFPDPAAVQGELLAASSASSSLVRGADNVDALVKPLLGHIETLVRVHVGHDDNVAERYLRFADQQAAYAEKLSKRVAELEEELTSLRKIGASFAALDATKEVELAKIKNEGERGTKMWNDFSPVLSMLAGHFMKPKGSNGPLPPEAAEATLKSFCRSLDQQQVMTILSCLRDTQQAIFGMLMKHFTEEPVSTGAAPSASAPVVPVAPSPRAPAPTTSSAPAREPTLFERMLAMSELLRRADVLEAILTPNQMMEIANASTLAMNGTEAGELPAEAREAFLGFFESVTDAQMAKLNGSLTVAEITKLDAFAQALRAAAVASSANTNGTGPVGGES